MATKEISNTSAIELETERHEVELRKLPAFVAPELAHRGDMSVVTSAILGGFSPTT